MNMNRLAPLLALMLAALALTQAAKADIVTWTLGNGRFANGDTVTGSFTWDTDLGTATAWSFTVAGSGTADFPTPFTYFSGSPGDNFLLVSDATDGRIAPGAAVLDFLDTTGLRSRMLRLGLAALDSLDTPVAALALEGDAVFAPTGLLECFECSPFRNGESGAFLSAMSAPAVVPAPPAPALLLAGLPAILASRRRR